MIEKIYRKIDTHKIPLYYVKKKESLYVSIQIWVHVGSVDESSAQYGMAHMIEHLFFKKTKTIGRGELDFLIYQMSGSSNAYTSKDFTVYLFTVPKGYLDELICILSSLFESQDFTPRDLLLEKDIVFQEIDLYKDDPFSFLIDETFLGMKMKYNYAHNILGTKDSIDHFSFRDIKDFFAKHYIPSRMMIFVSGDLTFFKIKKAFFDSFFNKPFSLKEKEEEKQYLVLDKNLHKVEYTQKLIFGETENNHFLACFHFPVCHYEDLFVFKALNLLVGGGKDSLLYTFICHELKLATDIKSFFHGMMKETFFFIYYNPVSVEDGSLIVAHVRKVIDRICKGLFSDEQLKRILAILEFEYEAMLSDDVDEFITMIAPYAFLKDYDFLKKSVFCFQTMKEKIIKLAQFFQADDFYLCGYLSQKEKETFDESLSLLSNNQKQKNKRKRKPLDNDIKGIHVISKKKLLDINADILYESISINKGLTLLLPKAQYNFEDEIIVIYFDTKVRYFHQDMELLGGVAFLFDWMGEGTKHLPGNLFARYAERYGIEFMYNTGFIEIRCLKKYLDQAFFLLKEYLLFPEWNEDSFSFLQLQVIENIKNFLDDPSAVAFQKMKETVYQNNPYGSNPSGTIETVSSFTPDKIKALYNKYIIPKDFFIIMIGFIDKDLVIERLRSLFSDWDREDNLIFSYDRSCINTKISFPKEKKFLFHTNKDQVVITFGGLTVKKYTKEYFALLIADQICSGGISGGMHSRLFMLREKTGFFYDISGSLILGSCEIEGMFFIKALTHPQHLLLAINAIWNMLTECYEGIQEEEVIFAKRLLLYSFAQKSETKEFLLQSIINQYRYNLSSAELKSHYTVLKNIHWKDIKDILKKYINPNTIVTIIYKNNTLN
jgi:predicted Zn-dependent peptidase